MRRWNFSPSQKAAVAVDIMKPVFTIVSGSCSMSMFSIASTSIIFVSNQKIIPCDFIVIWSRLLWNFSWLPVRPFIVVK